MTQTKQSQGYTGECPVKFLESGLKLHKNHPQVHMTEKVGSTFPLIDLWKSHLVVVAMVTIFCESSVATTQMRIAD